MEAEYAPWAVDMIVKGFGFVGGVSCGGLERGGLKTVMERGKRREDRRNWFGSFWVLRTDQGFSTG